MIVKAGSSDTIGEKKNKEGTESTANEWHAPILEQRKRKREYTLIKINKSA